MKFAEKRKAKKFSQRLQELFPGKTWPEVLPLYDEFQKEIDEIRKDDANNMADLLACMRKYEGILELIDMVTESPGQSWGSCRTSMEYILEMQKE